MNDDDMASAAVRAHDMSKPTFFSNAQPSVARMMTPNRLRIAAADCQYNISRLALKGQNALQHAAARNSLQS